MSWLLVFAAALSLPELEKQLLANNPEYQQAQAHVRMAEGMRVQAGLYPNPSIGSNGEHVTPTARGGSIGGFVDQRIVTAGKLGLAKGFADQEVQQAQAAMDAWRLRLTGQLRMRYYDAMAARERVTVRTELSKVAADFAKSARELRNLGILDEPDIRTADVEVARSALRLTQAQQLEERAWRELAALLNVDGLAAQELDGELDELPSLEESVLRTRLLEASPEFTVARSRIASAEIALRQARAARIPDLQIRAGVRNNRELVDLTGRPIGPEGIFDVAVEIPIFNRQQGQIAAAKAAIERGKQEPVRVRRSLDGRFAAAWQQYQSARAAAVRYRDEMIPASRQAFEMYQRNFRAMQAQYPLVIATQRSYFAARDEYIEVLQEGWRAAAMLESLLLAEAGEAGSWN